MAICSKCYRKISHDEVVEKTGTAPCQDRWGNYCKKCAKKLDKERGRFLTVFFSLWIVLFFGGIAVAVWKHLR